MTPEQLAKPGCSEHMEQAALFCWAAVAQYYGFETANDMDAHKQSAEWKANHMKMYNFKPRPELKWMHAIPNGGARGNDATTAAIRGGQLKAEGVKSGVADVFLPITTPLAAGLYIEMKKTGGKPSDISAQQMEFGDFVRTQGYIWCVGFGWRLAANFVEMYLTGQQSMLYQQSKRITGKQS